MPRHHPLFLFVIIALTFITGCTSLEPINKQDEFSLKVKRFAHAMVNDGEKIYVLAGHNGDDFRSDIEIIDPVSKTVSVLKHKLIPRRYFSAVWDGKESIYIIGGVSFANNVFKYEKRVEVFNTKTQQVSFAKPLPVPTRINTAVYLDGRIFVLGGSFPSRFGLTSSALVSVFDIEQDKWLRGADMPTRKDTRAFVKDGQIYVVGGYNNSSALKSFEQYDPKSNQWRTLPDLPEQISAHSLSLVNDKLYVFGDYRQLDLTYCYDFISQQWQKVDIGYKASRHNAATTLNNKVYVTGGIQSGNGPYLDDIQIFEL